MTSKEFIEYSQGGILLNDYDLGDVLWFMDNYAKHVLEIAAKKARVKAYYRGHYLGARWKQWKDDEDIYIMDNDTKHEVDKNSIINCLNNKI